jgi:hypothetical protein
VKAEVAGARPLRLAQPKLEGLERFLFAPRADHFDKSRRPADDRCSAGRLVCVLREGAHEGQINVHVRIDEPGKNVFPGRIDHFGVVRQGDLAIDPGDRLVLAKNVGRVAFVRRDDFACFIKSDK